MNDIRTLLFTILIYIVHIKVLSDRTVKLDRDHGIFLAIYILCLDIDLRTVECSFTISLYKGHLLLFQQLTQYLLCGLPVMLISQIFLLIGRIPFGKAEGYILFKAKH